MRLSPLGAAVAPGPARASGCPSAGETLVVGALGRGRFGGPPRRPRRARAEGRASASWPPISTTACGPTRRGRGVLRGALRAPRRAAPRSAGPTCGPARAASTAALEDAARHERYAFLRARPAEDGRRRDRRGPHPGRPGRDPAPAPAARRGAHGPRRDAAADAATCCGPCSASRGARCSPTSRRAASPWREDPTNADLAFAAQPGPPRAPAVPGGALQPAHRAPPWRARRGVLADEADSWPRPGAELSVASAARDGDGLAARPGGARAGPPAPWPAPRSGAPSTRPGGLRGRLGRPRRAAPRLWRASAALRAAVCPCPAAGRRSFASARSGSARGSPSARPSPCAVDVPGRVELPGGPARPGRAWPAAPPQAGRRAPWWRLPAGRAPAGPDPPSRRPRLRAAAAT